VKYWYLFCSTKIQNLLPARNEPLRVLGLGRHRRHVHVEVAAVHVDSNDRRFIFPDDKFFEQARKQTAAINDVDLHGQCACAPGCFIGCGLLNASIFMHSS
jgi:hypothetical protein